LWEGIKGIEMVTLEVQRCIIITGMSGGGKSTVLHLLEDNGMYPIDNIPPTLLPQLLTVLSKHEAAIKNGVAAVVDVRGDNLLKDLFYVIDVLRGEKIEITLLFLEASDETLLSRYEMTKRKHPLAVNISVLDAIKEERKKIAPVLERADIILDTSNLTLPELREKLFACLSIEKEPFTILLSSFGFKYGIPLDCDFLFDVRFLPNPYYDEFLRPLSGKDERVKSYLMTFNEVEEFTNYIISMLEYVLPLYRNTCKQQISVAVGCTGGRHRSVAIVDLLWEHFNKSYERIIVRHRDIEKEQES